MKLTDVVGETLLQKGEAAAGYTFRDKEHLALALIHASFDGDTNNQRLEFLGDAVLQLCTTRRLYEEYPQSSEGELSRLRASLVCEGALSLWAGYAGLGEALLLGKGEEKTGGRQKPSVLSDGAEALLGAIYLDGGLPAAERFTNALLDYLFAHMQEMSRQEDYKTRLQEELQKNGQISLKYQVIRVDGPAHQAQYTVELTKDGRFLSRGKGPSKKLAEQDAARCALQNL